MTCIIGLKASGRIWMGGDSAGVSGHSLTIRRDPKVFRNGPCLFGICGSFRLGNLLRYSLVVPKHPEGMDVAEWLNTLFVDAVRACLSKGGAAKKENEIEQSSGPFLVAYRGEFALIDWDYQVAFYADPFGATGCGDNVALGAMWALSKETGFRNPHRAVRLALEAAERHSAGVRGPFVIKSMKGDGI